VELKDQEKKLAHQLIESLAAPFAPEKYRDEYQENVKAMITRSSRAEVTEVAQPHMAPVIDLMEALKKSLAEKQAPPAAGRDRCRREKTSARAVEAIATVQKKGKRVAG